MSFFLLLVVGSGAVGQMGFETCLIFRREDVLSDCEDQLSVREGEERWRD